MRDDQVTPVLKALRSNGIDVVAIHHHMMSTQPTVYFPHCWGKGPAEKLATAVRAAVNQLGKAADASTLTERIASGRSPARRASNTCYAQ